MRAFLGIEVTDEVRAALSALRRELERCRARVRWVRPENVHVTLKFLGEVNGETAAQVGAVMEEAAGGGPFRFAVEGLGTFPPRGKPRVIWAGVSDGADAVSRLQARLEKGLQPIGFRKEQNFVPHLTIGRVKSPKNAEKLLPAIEGHAGTMFGWCTAAEMVLFESTLTPQGSVYSTVVKQAL